MKSSDIICVTNRHLCEGDFREKDLVHGIINGVAEVAVNIADTLGSHFH